MNEILAATTFSGFLSAAGAATLAAGLVLAVVLAADLALSRRVSARMRAALYLAVFVRLALPANWASPLGLLGHGARVQPHIGSTETTLAPAAEMTPTTPAAPLERRQLPATGLLLYAGIASALVLTWALARHRIARALAGATPPGARLAALAGDLPILEHPKRGPAVFGLMRPSIVIPTGLAATLTDDALRAVLAHEAAHVRRRDPLRLAAMQLAVFAAWPAIPAWLAAWRVRGLMEQACD